MLRQSIGWIYFVLYTLAPYMINCDTMSTWKTKADAVRPSHHRPHTDPKVLSMLEEIFGKEEKEESQKSKGSLTPSNNTSDVSTDKFYKTASLMKGGTLPLVDFMGFGNEARKLIEEQNEMSNCLRLVRQTQAKLKYLWNRIYDRKPSAGNEIVVVGMEKTTSKDSNNLEVPLTLQIGEPSVKS